MNITAKQRLFIGIMLPEYTHQPIVTLQQLIKKENLVEGRFVPQPKLHLTLQFIGAVEQTIAAAIITKLHSITIKPLHVCFDSLILLPENNARVIALSTNNALLQEFALQIKSALQLIITPEQRAFAPHITIARITPSHNQTALRNFIHTLEIAPICFTIQEIQLVESLLTDGIYKTVATFKAQ